MATCNETSHRRRGRLGSFFRRPFLSEEQADGADQPRGWFRKLSGRFPNLSPLLRSVSFSKLSCSVKKWTKKLKRHRVEQDEPNILIEMMDHPSINESIQNNIDESEEISIEQREQEYSVFYLRRQDEAITAVIRDYAPGIYQTLKADAKLRKKI